MLLLLPLLRARVEKGANAINVTKSRSQRMAKNKKTTTTTAVARKKERGAQKRYTRSYKGRRRERERKQ